MRYVREFLIIDISYYLFLLHTNDTQRVLVFGTNSKLWLKYWTIYTLIRYDFTRFDLKINSTPFKREVKLYSRNYILRNDIYIR